MRIASELFFVSFVNQIHLTPRCSTILARPFCASPRTSVSSATTVSVAIGVRAVLAVANRITVEDNRSFRRSLLRMTRECFAHQDDDRRLADRRAGTASYGA